MSRQIDVPTGITNGKRQLFCSHNWQVFGQAISGHSIE